MPDGKRTILAVGGSGLVGSRIIELLQDEFAITNVSLETGVDITSPQTLTPLLKAPPETVVLHLAAKADVDSCEKDKPDGENGAAWKINVQGAENVAQACKKAGNTMIYVSTDFVFGGENTPQGGYGEDDLPNPGNWYAVTKYEGERRVLASGAKSVIMRIAYPYRRDFPKKLDFVRAIKQRLEKNDPIKVVTDHIMTPTFIDDIAQAVRILVKNNTQGMYHVVGSSSHTPYDASVLIAKTFGIENPRMTKTTRAEFFKDRAPRPFNLTLRNDKIKQLGATMKTFEEGLEEIKNPKP